MMWGDAAAGFPCAESSPGVAEEMEVVAGAWKSSVLDASAEAARWGRCGALQLHGSRLAPPHVLTTPELQLLVQLHQEAAIVLLSSLDDLPCHLAGGDCDCAAPCLGELLAGIPAAVPATVLHVLDLRTWHLRRSGELLAEHRSRVQCGAHPAPSCASSCASSSCGSVCRD